MKQSESIKNLATALVKAQSEITNLYPSSKGYGYDYVPLEKVIDLLKEVLPKFGLGYIQLPVSGQDGTTVGLTTRIIHESGEWIEESAEFPITDMKGVNKTQAGGAAITYFRRYSLISAFGITGDKDVDVSDKAFTKTSEPEEKRFPETPEAKQLKLKIVDLIAENKLTGKALERANALMSNNDVDGMKKCIEYATAQKSA